jgi:hypothetical protein
MSSQKLTSLTSTIHNVDHARRETLLDKRTKGERSKRRFLAWLVDDGVAGRKSGLVTLVYIGGDGAERTAAFQAKSTAETFQAPIPAHTPMGSR